MIIKILSCLEGQRRTIAPGSTFWGAANFCWSFFFFFFSFTINVLGKSMSVRILGCLTERITFKIKREEMN